MAKTQQKRTENLSVGSVGHVDHGKTTLTGMRSGSSLFKKEDGKKDLDRNGVLLSNQCEPEKIEKGCRLK